MPEICVRVFVWWAVLTEHLHETTTKKVYHNNHQTEGNFFARAFELRKNPVKYIFEVLF